MPKVKQKKILTAIEIGTSKIKVLIAEILEDGALSIIGNSEARTFGKVRKADINDQEFVFEQLGKAVLDAEDMANCDVEEILLSISGNSIKYLNHRGTVPIYAENRQVSAEDIINATRNARSAPIPHECTILNTLDKHYIIDGKRKVQNPLGQIANKLDSEIHIIFGQRNIIETKQKVIEDCLNVDDVGTTFSGLCSAYGAFNDNSLEMGTLVLDIGAGTTEYVLYHDKACQHSGVLTVGCDQIVNDLAIGLNLDYKKCMKILNQSGSAISLGDGRNRQVEVLMFTAQKARRIPRASIEFIIEDRLREIFEIVQEDLKKNGLMEFLGGGILICGGGAFINDITVLAKDVFNVPVKIGRPLGVNGPENILNSPAYCCPVGLLKIGMTYMQVEESNKLTPGQEFKLELKKVVSNIKNAIKW